jgi:hypothetical protein
VLIRRSIDERAGDYSRISPGANLAGTSKFGQGKFSLGALGVREIGLGEFSLCAFAWGEFGLADRRPGDLGAHQPGRHRDLGDLDR